MAYEWRPGMEMYEAVWKRDGEEIFRLVTHAANEADVIALAHEMVADHPELDLASIFEGTTVEVGHGPTRPAPYEPDASFDLAQRSASVPSWGEEDQKRLNDILASLT